MKKFITQKDQTTDIQDWGNLIWMSSPKVTDARQLVVIEVNLKPGNGHNFHKHPQQEEVIYVISGAIEQWVGQEKCVLKAGESAFIPADEVHASFNVGSTEAKLLAILSPCIGEEGYELVDVMNEDPWNSIRG